MGLSDSGRHRTTASLRAVPEAWVDVAVSRKVTLAGLSAARLGLTLAGHAHAAALQAFTTDPLIVGAYRIEPAALRFRLAGKPLRELAAHVSELCGPEVSPPPLATFREARLETLEDAQGACRAVLHALLASNRGNVDRTRLPEVVRGLLSMVLNENAAESGLGLHDVTLETGGPESTSAQGLLVVSAGTGRISWVGVASR